MNRIFELAPDQATAVAELKLGEGPQCSRTVKPRILIVLYDECNLIWGSFTMHIDSEVLARFKTSNEI